MIRLLESRLRRRDLPKPGESITGYLVRLTELNGYNNPFWISDLAGLTQDVSVTSFVFSDKADLSPLAYLCGLTSDKLEPMLYRPAPSAGSTPMNFAFGLPINRHMISVKKPRVCPECLQTFGYARSIWELRPVTVCPLHHKILMEKCPECGRDIPWFRNSLSTCRCGCNWLEINQPLVSEENLGLTTLSYRLCGIDITDAANYVEPSKNPLYSSDLNSVLVSVVFVASQFNGKLDTTGKILCSLGNEELHDLLSKAFLTFDDWPDNFIRFLHWRIGRENKSKCITGLQKDFGNFYYGLYHNLKAESFDFIRQAFEQFIHDHWAGGTSNKRPTLLGSKALENRVSLSEAGKRLNLSFSTVRSFVKRGLLSGIFCGDQNGMHLIERGSLEELAIRINDSVSAEQAAEMLGIGTEILMCLVKKGLLVPIRKSAKGTYLFEREKLNEILSKVENTVSSEKREMQPERVSFQEAAHIIAKIGSGISLLLEEVLSGTIRPCGETDGDGLRRFVFDKKDILNYLSNRLKGKKKGMLSIAQAAKLLGMKYESACLLINKGILYARKISGDENLGSLLTKKDIDDFEKNYITSVRLARMAKTSPPFLVKVLLKNNITPVAGREDNRGLYYIFRKSDISSLNIRLLVSRERKNKKPKWPRKTRLIGSGEVREILGISEYKLSYLINRGYIKPVNTEARNCGTGGRKYFSRFEVERCRVRLSNKDLVSTTEAAKMLGEEPSWFARKWLRTGYVKIVDVGDKLGAHFFRKSDIKRLVALKNSSVTGTEAAKILGVHRTAVLKLKNRGILKPVSGPGIDGVGCYRYSRNNVLYAKRALAAKNFLSVKEAASALGLSREALMDLKSRGILRPTSGPGIDGSRRFLYLRKDVKRVSKFAIMLAKREIMNVNEAAERLGIAVPTFYVNWVKTGKIKRVDFHDKLGNHYFRKSDVDVLSGLKRKWITSSEVAEVLGVNLATIWSLRDKGILRPISGPGVDRYVYYVYSRSDVEHITESEVNSAKNEIITESEAATMLGDNLRWFYKKWVSTGCLKPVDHRDKLSKYYFRRSDVDALALQEKSTVTGLEAAAILGVHGATVNRMRKKGILTPISGPGLDGSRWPLYLRRDVQQFLEKRLNVDL